MSLTYIGILTAIHALNIIRYFNKWGWVRDPERTRFNSPLRRH